MRISIEARKGSLVFDVTNPSTGHTTLVDFEQFSQLDRDFLEEVCKAFLAMHSHLGLASIASAARDISRFLRFLNERSDGSLESNVALYFDDLKKLRSAARSWRRTARTIDWLQENGVARWQNVIVPGEPPSSPKGPWQQVMLSEEHIKSIVDACRVEVDEVWRLYEKGVFVEQASASTLSEEDIELKAYLLTARRLGAGTVPTRKQIVGQRDGAQMRQGGLGVRRMRRYLEPTFRDLLPFYLLLVIQAVANSISILEIDEDCLQQSLDDRERVVWEKGRAGATQWRDFSSQKKYAPPELVRKLRKLTDAARKRASDDVKKKLFIHRANDLRIKVPSNALVHLYLRQFRKRHSLPKFSPSDLRRSVADHHLKKHRDPRAVKALLQHRDIRTTSRYIDRNQIGSAVAEVIDEYQGALLSAAQKVEQKPQAPKIGSQKFETVFGFGCADPLSGIAPGSSVGKPCSHFTGCATCRNAVVVVDSADCIARILQAERELEVLELRVHGSPEASLRYRALYAPIAKVIRTRILPSVPEAVLARAHVLVTKLPPLLPLEA